MDSSGQSIRLREDLIWRAVEDEVIVLDRRTWSYLSVNPSGAFLWPRVVSGSSRDRLADALATEFGLDATRALAEVDDFVSKLEDHGLLRANAG
jgi:Coenzyme PQQ synthesis protein D (PqqD)